MTRTAPQRIVPQQLAPPAARRRPLRLVLAIVGVLAVLVGGGFLARMWVMQQYYVGADAGQVVIFQGVRGDVLGLPLSSVAEHTDIALDDLPETERSQVKDGILPTEDGLGGARELVERLRDRRLEPCPPPAPPPVVEPVQPVQPVQPADPNAQPQPPVDTTPLPEPVPVPGTTCRSVS
jgi:protein phosphatase